MMVSLVPTVTDDVADCKADEGENGAELGDYVM